MLRQIHIFLKSEILFVKDYAMALGSDELNNVKRIIQKYIDMPMPGKTFHRPVSNFQIFHRASDDLYFLFITDLTDSLQYIDQIILKTIDMFKTLFPNAQDIKEPSASRTEFIEFLVEIQKEIHSKVAIIGPENAGKTTLYNLLRSGDEKTHMDFAKTSNFEIDGVCFDLWDFQLKDNFSLLWSKFIRGSDLVIIIFNLANYNLKMLNHFINLQKIESNYSKLLIIGNKRDLVEKADIKRIKNELNISDFEEISLNSPEANSQVRQLIIKTLGLKKKKPPEFDSLIKEVDEIVRMRNFVPALAKYKELLNLSKSYQSIIHTKTIEEKIEQLNKKIREEAEKRREIETTIEFTVAKPLAFSRKITVKPLPTEESSTQPEVDQAPMVEKPSESSEPLKKMVTFQKLEKKVDLKPLKIPKIPVKTVRQPSTPKEPMEDTATAKTEDIKIVKPKMPMELFTPHEDVKKDMEKPLIINFTKELQRTIIEKGSSLSLELCEKLITELQKSLGRPLKLEDVELAADFFVKQEKLS
ncbi:MAG: ADP-ribosylation factor-like protein [Promethearchaeota archaeon]